ncbi:inhibitor of sigma-G Gin [Alkalithermobacter paradoxus]|uniref:Inhibitor of sigma-G Gin n=2 Tax=Alkalithermobacter paradoxus TaxID=29349 RepID=A0A1V4I4X8_9FIRM|nr:inhibitor of sigma-G Gin [[Clostridium] thermoalcaliphilum]
MIENGGNPMQCSICSEERLGGIDVLGSYICRRCEDEMIKEDLNELKLEYYKNRMRSLWRNKLS